MDNFDQTDSAILMILQEQGRLSYRHIGSIVGLSTPSVTERIHRMEQCGIIQGYKAVIDFDTPHG